MSARRSETLLSSLGVLGLSRASVLCMNLAATSHLARTLDTANFGINSFAASLVAYFMVFVGLGFETFATRTIAFDQSRMKTLVDGIISTRLLLAALMFAALAGTAMILPIGTLGRVVVLIQGLNLFSSAIGLSCIYAGLKQMRTVAAREFAASLLSVTCVYLFVRGPADVVYAAATSVAALLLTNMAVLIQYFRDFGAIRLHLPGRADLAQARATMDFFWSILMITITYNMHMVLLGVLRNEAEVGLFSVGWKLFNFTIMVPNLIAATILPRIAKATDNLQLRAHTSEVAMRAMIVAAVPITMLGEALVPQVVTLLFGPAYLSACSSVALLLVNALVVTVNVAFGTPLSAVGRQRDLLRVVTVGAAVGVGLSLVLIPTLGVLGASIATLADEGMIMAMLAFTQPEIPVTRVLTFGLRCLLAVTPASVAAHLIANRPEFAGSAAVAIAVAGMAGGLIYVACLRLLRIDLVEFASVLMRL